MKKLDRMTKAELIRRIDALEKDNPSAVTAFEHERLNHDLRQQQRESETQKRELREAQHLLEISRNRYADLYDFAPIGYTTLNARSAILEINLTAAGMLGLDRNRLLGTPFRLHVPSRDLTLFRQHLTGRSSPEACIQTDLHIIRADKTSLAVSMQSVASFDEERGEEVYRAVFIDMTAREHTDQAQRDHEARLRTILDTATEGIITIDDHGAIESFNRAAETLFGYLAREVIGRNVEMLMPSPHRENHDGYLSHYRETGEQKIIGVGREVVGQRKDGSLFPIELSVSDVKLTGRRIFTGFVRDITERKEAEKRVREQMRRYQSLVEVSPDAIYVIKNGRIEFTNAEGVRLLGLNSPSQILGKSPYDFVRENRQENIRQRVNTLSGLGRGVGISPVVEEKFVRPDGSVRWVTVTSALFTENDETALLLVLRDITEHKRLENEILEIGDREQQNIGHELHDGLGQQLTAMEMKLYLLSEDLALDDLNSIRKTLEDQARQLGEMLRSCVTVTRSLAQGLTTINLTGEGLTASLSQLAAHASVVGKTECHFDCPVAVTHANTQMARHLYRIAQEAVNNALKHARAKNIYIRLTHKEGVLNLQIKDDGRGRPRHRGSKPGMGLEIMRHRANMIGATFDVVSARGEGVTINCELPFKNYEHKKGFKEAGHDETSTP